MFTMSFAMPPTQDPAFLSYVLEIALWALGGLATVSMAALLYIWRTAVKRMDGICEERKEQELAFCQRIDAMAKDHRDLEDSMVNLEKDLLHVKSSALTYPDARRIFEELFTSFHEGQGRIEGMLNSLSSEMKNFAMKMAILEDRERRRDELR